jgi:hypothetical protein
MGEDQTGGDQMTGSKHSEKLGPCPFCGNEPELDQEYPEEIFSWQVRCTNRKCHIMPSGVFESSEEAIAAWNKRTTHDTEALKEANKLLRRAMNQLISVNDPVYSSRAMADSIQQHLNKG